jgi:hypothetical protein
MIIESILTTTDAKGAVNCAPMGVEWGDDAIVIKPFVDTATFRNLQATKSAVINLTDDVMLFAEAVTGNPVFPHHRATKVKGVVLDAACSWREVEVESIDGTPPRSRIVTRVVHRGTQRDFLGFNRARHAVLEAAILATRTHLIPAGEIQVELARLQVIVDKTASDREQEAMSLLRGYIHSRQPAPARG